MEPHPLDIADEDPGIVEVANDQAVDGEIAGVGDRLLGTVAASAPYLTFAAITNLGTRSSSYVLSQAQSTLKADRHLMAANPSFVNPHALDPAGYALVAGSPGSASSSTPGRVGGLDAGAAVDMGARGGTDVNTGRPIAQIGCEF